MAKKTRSTPNSNAENSSAQAKKTAPTESKGTARDVYMKLIATDPRWKEVKTSGKTFTILGARPPTKPAPKTTKAQKQKLKSRRADTKVISDAHAEPAPPQKIEMPRIEPDPRAELDRDGSEQWLKRMDPRQAHFLCTFEGDYNKYSYYIQEGRAHWILWLRLYDGNYENWETPIVIARLPFKGFDGTVGDAAIILLTASLVNDRRTFGAEGMGLNDVGLLSMDEANALLDTVDQIPWEG